MTILAYMEKRSGLNDFVQAALGYISKVLKENNYARMADKILKFNLKMKRFLFSDYRRINFCKDIDAVSELCYITFVDIASEYKNDGGKEGMKKPYIVCHMMTSLDGRIDCAMVGQLTGVEEYYATLGELNLPSTLSGRVTAQLEMALPGTFQAKNGVFIGQEGFSKKVDATGYEIVVDTKGTLLWEKETDTAKPHLIITSEQVSKEYLDYLDELHISWIACGKDKIDLKRAAEILAEEFGVERLGIVGGPAINSAFLEAGLLDEVSILIGLGIDGRKGMPGVFDGFPMEKIPTPLKLKDVKTYGNGSVWLRYLV